MECSWHRHREKYNVFALVDGKVGIVTEEISGRKETILRGGQSFIVKPGQWHKFRAYEDSIMVEEMYVEYDEGDIERQTVGGKFESREII